MLSLEHVTGNNMEDWVEMLIEQLEVVGKKMVVMALRYESVQDFGTGLKIKIGKN